MRLSTTCPALYPLHGDTYVFSHEKKVEDETCYFTSEEQHASLWLYVLTAPVRCATPKSDLHTEAGKRHVYRAIHGLLCQYHRDHLCDLLLFQREKFIISSPLDIAQYMKGDTFDSVVNGRPYWINTIRFGQLRAKTKLLHRSIRWLLNRLRKWWP